MNQKHLDTGIRQDEHSSQAVFSVAYFSAMVARILAPIMQQVPIGYEDESGFHAEKSPVSDSGN
jgi:hypothetical protein